MKIYTKTGDDGTTGLFNGERVLKYDLRVETYGTVDELNSVIGIAISAGAPEPLKQHLIILNNLLFNLGSDLASPLDPPPQFEVPRIKSSNITWLERTIDSYTAELPELTGFILPGGTLCTSHLHYARTVCRRAERLAVRLAENADLGENVLIFLNRLSDYLFTAARYANYLEQINDTLWDKNAL
jgi:cob(I)alamin adenosyltransferase